MPVYRLIFECMAISYCIALHCIALHCIRLPLQHNGLVWAGNASNDRTASTLVGAYLTCQFLVRVKVLNTAFRHFLSKTDQIVHCSLQNSQLHKIISFPTKIKYQSLLTTAYTVSTASNTASKSPFHDILSLKSKKGSKP